jgi:hypothetical protein
MTASAKSSQIVAPAFITQSEATAAQRTIEVHLVATADQTNVTGIVPVVTLSKAGGAFAAMAGAITELTFGWYKIVLAAADCDTIGVLAIRVTGTGADDANGGLEVEALDVNAASVAVGSVAAGAINAAALAADAIAALSAPLEVVTKSYALVANGTPAISMKGAQDAFVDLSGTYGGGSAQVQTCEDPTVAVPVWTNSGAAQTSGTQRIQVVGPHSAVRVSFTGSTSPALAVVFTIRTPKPRN